MRKFFVFLCCTIALVTARAQFTVAVIGGPQSASVSPQYTLLPDTTTKNVSNRTGIRIGFLANMPVNEKGSLFFQTGFIYSPKGSRTQQLYDSTGIVLTRQKTLLLANTNLSTNYIDIPLNLLVKLPLKGKTKFIIGGGPQVSLFYSGKTEFNTLSVSQAHRDSAIKYEYKEDNIEDLPVGKGTGNYKTLHFAANAFGGLEFGRVFITVNYSTGLTPFLETESNRFKHQTIGGTLGIYLGKPAKQAPVVKDKDKDGIVDAEDECPTLPGGLLTHGCPDKDGDGIADQNDQCPDEAGTAINKGCPVLDKDNDSVPDADDACPEVAGLVKYKGCPVPDTDKDGVNDEEDACPSVEGLAKYKGCPIPDSDKDGVNDEEDGCPNEAGVKENNGCPQVAKELVEKVAYAARQIQFEYQKAQLTNASLTVLNEVAELLNKNPELNITVEGHTSGAHSTANMQLSQQRAEKVKEYFITKGIAAERITAVGYGSSRPLNNSSNAAENAKNRRVELKLAY